MSISREILKGLIEKEIGYEISETEDFSLNNYIDDSIMLIQVFISIEREIGCELPDDFFDSEALDSIDGFTEKLNDFLCQTQEKE